jgi:hypothetical protein
MDRSVKGNFSNELKRVTCNEYFLVHIGKYPSCGFLLRSLSHQLDFITHVYSHMLILTFTEA